MVADFDTPFEFIFHNRNYGIFECLHINGLAMRAQVVVMDPLHAVGRTGILVQRRGIERPQATAVGRIGSSRVVPPSPPDRTEEPGVVVPGDPE